MHRDVTQAVRRVEIRQAGPADAPAIAQVLLASFEPHRPSYTPAAFDATVLDEERVGARMREGPLWVAVLDGAIVGTGSAVATETGCYVRGMGVMPSGRGHHIGRRLLEAIESFAREGAMQRMYLSTTPFLDRAIGLYERYGFRRIGDGPTHLFGTPLFSMELRLAGDPAKRSDP